MSSTVLTCDELVAMMGETRKRLLNPDLRNSDESTATLIGRLQTLDVIGERSIDGMTAEEVGKFLKASEEANAAIKAASGK